MTNAPFAQEGPLPEIIEPGSIEKLTTGFQFTEGPVWTPAGRLRFSDIPASRIYEWSAESDAVVFREPSNHSNGLTLDANGRLVMCEHGARCVARLETDGARTVLADRWEGRRLNSPNDVAIRRDGLIYFTDPPFGVEPEDREIDFQGVYAIHAGGQIKLRAKGFNKPNGLAFSPDEKILYVNDTADRVIWRFDVREDGELGERALFADMASPESRGSPDGMKVDWQGHVYCTGPGAVWVFEPDGTLMGKIALPELAANLAFGDADGCGLYFTARSSIYRARARVPGIGPALPKSPRS